MLSLHQVMPNGGWKFKIGNTTIISENLERLISNVRAHKKSNGLLEGDIHREIFEQIKEAQPNFKIQNFKMEIKK